MFGFRNGTFAGLGLKVGNFTAGFFIGFAEALALDVLGAEPANATEINLEELNKSVPVVNLTVSTILSSSKLRSQITELIAGALPNLLF